VTKSLGLPALSAGALSVLSDNCPLSDTTLHPLHGALSADPLVAEYCRAARADNTRRAYAADLAHFRHWGGHLPSTPDAVARYLAQHAATLKPVTLRRRLAALATAHRDHGAADPTKHTLVARVMQGIERKHGCPPNQVAPLLIEDLARIVARMGGSLLDLRDRAILLVGFFGALRRSELVALEVDDIQWMAEGIAITLRKSKTDQTRQGRAIRLAVRNDQ
jgi:integrase